MCRQGSWPKFRSCGHSGGVLSSTHMVENKRGFQRADGCWVACMSPLSSRGRQERGVSKGAEVRMGAGYLHSSLFYLHKKWPSPLKFNSLAWLSPLTLPKRAAKGWLFVVTVYCTLCRGLFFPPFFISSSLAPVLTCCVEFYQASLSNAPRHWV